MRKPGGQVRFLCEPININNLRKIAKRHLPRVVFDFLDVAEPKTRPRYVGIGAPLKRSS
jgi:hypothetical protein